MMKQRLLGSTGLRVSELCLGTMTFGNEKWGCDEQTSIRLINRYIETGGNFIDTANIYAEGRSEEIVGRAIHEKRDEIVLATKGVMPTSENPNHRGAGRKNLIYTCEQSLRRLNTDYIDIFYVHMWDELTPLEETLAALDHLTQAGKIRYAGCSNYNTHQLTRSLYLADMMGMDRFAVIQNQYSLVCRLGELELLPACLEEGVGFVSWSPLAGGLLSGKYTREDLAEKKGKSQEAKEGRLSKWEDNLWTGFMTEENFDAMNVQKEIAERHNKTEAQVAIAWQLEKPGVTAPIIGVRKNSHLDQSLGSVGGWLSEEEVDLLNEAFRLPPDPLADFVERLTHRFLYPASLFLHDEEE